MVKMTNKLQKKHMEATTEGNNVGYIDREQINQKESYYIQSRPRNVGGAYVYQYITMNDGTVYKLYSMTTSTKGIIANTRKAENVLQREVKQYKDSAIYY